MSPIFQQPHHICIVVPDIAAAIRTYESVGIGPWRDYPPLSEYTELEMPNEADVILEVCKVKTV